MLIRTLTLADIPTAVPLLHAAYGATHLEPRLRRYLAIEPEGWFVLVNDGSLVAVGGTLVYGTAAYLGLVATAPAAQRRGFARALMSHLISWCQGRGVATILLDASEKGAPLYEKLGFVDDGTSGLFTRFARWVAPVQAEAWLAPVASLATLGLGWIDEIARFDARIFGAGRESVLRSYFADDVERVWIARDAGKISGYVVAQSNCIGPWLAQNEEVAASLLHVAQQVVFTEPPSLRVPSKNACARLLATSVGFTLQRELRHMRLGPSLVAETSKRFGLGSFVTG